MYICFFKEPRAATAASTRRYSPPSTGPGVVVIEPVFLLISNYIYLPKTVTRVAYGKQ